MAVLDAVVDLKCVEFHQSENSRQKGQLRKESDDQTFFFFIKDLMCGMHRLIELWSQRRSRAALMDSMHQEDQTDKQ